MDAIHNTNLSFLKKYLLSGWFQWLNTNSSIELSYFSSGWGTHLYLIVNDDRQFLARINFFPGKNDWQVKRTEFTTLKEIESLNIAPRAYLLDEDNELWQDFTVVDYVEWKNTEYFSDTDIVMIARDLHRLHTFSVQTDEVLAHQYTCRIFDEFSGGEDKKIEHYDYPGIERVFSKYNSIKNELGVWFNGLSIFHECKNLCLCHADLKSENILKTATGIMLIDWECADIDIPETDIGRLFAGCTLSHEQQIIFLREYYGSLPDTRTMNRILAVKTVLDFFRIIENYCIHKRKPFDAEKMLQDLIEFEKGFQTVKHMIAP